MAATAVGCLWLLYRQTGQAGLVLGAGSAVLLALLLAGYSFFQQRGVRAGWPVAVLTALLLAFALWQAPTLSTAAVRAPAGAETWSSPRVASYLVRGHPVFVYFTADWCLSCKVNEAAAIDRAEVRRAFREADVKVLAADWTNGDPAITRFLESRGRAGVPLYLWYEPGREAEELPQILTPGMLIERARR
ncbi:MAG TPA: thioredoxin family protein, partial [Sphingomicrobium sp.]|nr:thioredoxin family protein [Sphingomicrobium sp.]